MKKWITLVSLAMFTGLLSCNNDAKLNGIITIESEFETTVEDWQSGFSGYSSSTPDSTLQLTLDRARLPGILDSTRYGIKAESYNRGDVMFMFLKKRVSGLRPATTYLVTFDMTIGTQYADNVTGASSGNDTYIKAGASVNEPTIKPEGGKYTISINKGNLSGGSSEMAVMGNITNGTNNNQYRLVTRSNRDQPITVTADANGELWLCIGTDSGFKGLTTLFYDRIKAELTLQN